MFQRTLGFRIQQHLPLRYKMKKKCKIQNCERPHEAHNYCRFHGRRKIAGKPLLAPNIRDWSKKYSVDGNGCWNWNGSLDRDGYGRFGRGETTKAHRIVWIKKKGEIPEGMHLDHLCKNRKCVNPKHLEIVTPKQNVRRSDTTHLTFTDAQTIRALSVKGIEGKALAKNYLVSPSTISMIVNRKRWGDD